MSALENARRLDAERTRKREAERSQLIAKLRKLIVADVAGTDPPDPAEIIEVCDQLGIEFDKFEEGVNRHRRRIADVEGLARVPKLKRQAEELEAKERAIATEASKAKDELQRAVDAVKNRDGGRTFSFYDRSTTPAQLAAIREVRVRFMELADQQWLLARDAGLIREEIRNLGKIDQDNIDPDCGENPPNDFVVPVR